MAQTIAVGQVIHVGATLLDAQSREFSPDFNSATYNLPVWGSSDSSKATVTPLPSNRYKAKITGIATGSANITMTVDGVTGTLSVTVYTPSLSSISIDI